MSVQPDLTAAAQMPGDLESVFNTSEYFDTGAMDVSSPVKNGTALPSATGNTNAPTTNNAGNNATNTGINGFGGVNGMNGTSHTNGFGAGPTLGEPTAAFDRLETLSPNENLGSIGNATLQQYINSHANTNTNGPTAMEGVTFTSGTDSNDAGNSTGMDTVNDGLQGNATGGL